MPQRSNLFQKLVASVQQGFGAGWTITESEMLQDSRTGEPREVDVVVRGIINGIKIVFGIECRDHKRPSDVTWVEQMAQKHADLETTNLVLWSASGFSEPALIKAKSLKIEAVSQRNAAKTVWAEMARHVTKGTFQYVEPNFTASVDVERPTGEKERFASTPGMYLTPSDFDVEFRYPLIGVLERIKNLPELGTTLLDHAPEGAGVFTIIYTNPVPSHIFGEEHTNLGLFVQMVIGVRTTAGTAPIDAKTVVLDGVAYTLASATTPYVKWEMQIKESEGQEPRIALTKHTTQQGLAEN